jgi:hypothetical protein
MERCLKLGTVFQHPAIDGGMIHGDATLLHKLFELTAAQGIGHISVDVREDDVLLEVSAFETDHDRPAMSDRGDHTRAGVQKKIRDSAVVTQP